MSQAEGTARVEGMVDTPVRLDELLQAHEDPISEIVGKMTEQQRRFVLSIERGDPDWALLDLPGAKDLPAVQWKLRTSRS